VKEQWAAATEERHQVSGLSQGISSLLRATAVEAAQAAGAVLKVRFGKHPLVETTPAHDVKLELDRICEARIIAVIRDNFPNHAVLSEECGFAPGSAPFVWVVDPLDGTVNYFHGLPFFCTSVSCYEIGGASWIHASLPDGRMLGRPLVGVVYAPLADELFEAVAGGSAWRNGELLETPRGDGLAGAIASIALSSKPPAPDYVRRVLPQLLERAQKVRCLGSTALEIVHVAAGRIGAYLQNGTNLWDFAGAAVVLKEAGGVFEATRLEDGRFGVLACNPGVYSEVRGLVSE